jgi:tRNA uridine 5-carboxymethylaminomethyl modification enzyme
MVYSTDATANAVRNNLHQSPMYSGVIKGIGTRYCPSFEDKIMRFPDHPRHLLYLEPEGVETGEYYINGLSTSLPVDVQREMVHSIPGLENAEISRYAYAIEYDFLPPEQLERSLKNKYYQNLFTAGQINGTSGYEEAAGQGIIAGINAVLKIDNKEPLILKRNEAYIGVLIDDLVTKGVIDPYRLLTSRAEYRLLLRHDNADLRLMDYGRKIGLVDDNAYKIFEDKKNSIKELEDTLKSTKITPKKEINDYLESIGSNKLFDGINLYNLLKRPEIEFEHIKRFLDKEYDIDVSEEVEINIKYEGYISKAIKEANKMLEYENIKLDENLDYDTIPNLAKEARQKLNEIKPISIGQALRISGVNPADITMIMIYLKRKKNE